MLWLGESVPKPSQRFQVIVVSLQQAVGNPLPLIWELKGAVFYCSSNNILPAPSAPPPGALWWLRSHSLATGEWGSGGAGLVSRLNAGERETQMKFVGSVYVNLRLPTRFIPLEGVTWKPIKKMEMSHLEEMKWLCLARIAKWGVKIKDTLRIPLPNIALGVCVCLFDLMWKSPQSVEVQFPSMSHVSVNTYFMYVVTETFIVGLIAVWSFTVFL